MRLAEVFLRIGSALTGWLVAYAHCLWLAVLPQAPCGGDAGNPYAATLGLALPAVALALLVPVGRRTPGVGDILRWFGLPLVVLLPLALRPVWSAFGRATLDGGPLCTQATAVTTAGWEPWWAPIQFAVLCVIAGAAVIAARSLSDDPA